MFYITGGPVPTHLNEVTVPVVPNKECQSWFYEAGHAKSIKPEFICAGYKKGKKDSCEVSWQTIIYITF